MRVDGPPARPRPIRRDATIKEIAHVAGVGVATVDRVIHGRPNVRPEKVERVLKAIARLNHDRDRRMAETRGVAMRVGLVAHSGRSFLDTIVDSAAAAAALMLGDGIAVDIHPVVDPDPEAIAAAILAAADRAEGLVVIAPEHPAIHRAVDMAVDGGVPVICATTDLPATRRLGYVGINQLHAGRTAAHLMSMILGPRDGDVVIAVGNAFRCQAEREMGFRRYLREHRPGLTVREIVDVRNDPAVAYQAIRRAFADSPRPLGVYAVSGGNTGIARALVEAGLPTPPVFIGHELNPNSRQLLIDGVMHATIDHDTVTEMRWCFEQLLRSRQGRPLEPRYFVPQPPRLVLRENVD
jgi:LacI family transcriptional regulator